VHALKTLGFHITHSDPGVFYTYINEHILILVVYVNNCIFTGSSNNLIASYKEKLNSCYVLTNLGPLHWLLGIKITCDHAAHIILLSQLSYIDLILSQFSFANAKAYRSPMVPGATYSKKDAPATADKAARMKCTPYC
jgi:reverse transcriptase-like protein